MIAIKNQNLYIITQLLQQNINFDLIDNKKRSFVYYIFKYNKMSIITKYNLQHCLKNDKDINGKDLIHHCAQNKNIKALKYLINFNLDFNQQDEYGFTPLMLNFKEKRCNRKILKLLLSKNIDVNKQTNLGFTCLMFAVQLQKIKVVKQLLIKGANTNIICI